MSMDAQRQSVSGRVFDEGEPGLQDALRCVHGTLERPRCLCVPGGVPMYVSFQGRYVAKRMPGSGGQHHPACPSFEPAPDQSGLGELIGEAVLESATGQAELRVDFVWSRRAAMRAVAEQPSQASGAVRDRRRQLSLRALAHYLFERAQLNRWSPAMTGKRTQGVLHKYLTQAAQDIVANGVPLAERLYVPEPFSEATHAEATRRRRQRLQVLRSSADQVPLAIVMAQFKAVEPWAGGRRVWLKHMPDAPLLVSDKAWLRIERTYARELDALCADRLPRARLMVVALIRARDENIYEIDSASLMLASEQWIPVEAVHELPLVQALVDSGRRFIKPLRYDARCAGAFANALLLDCGVSPVPLHVISPFLPEREREAKGAAVQDARNAWVWSTAEPMPTLPVPARRRA
jgi:hypothetical protein